MRPVLTAVTAAVAIVTAAGCSGAGSDALSKEEFISQGDAVCAQLDTDAEALEAPTDEDDFGSYLTDLADLAKGAREELAALDAPEDGVEVRDALLEAIDTSVGSIEEAADAADDGATVGAGDLAAQAAEEGSAADEQLQDYGFQECGQA